MLDGVRSGGPSLLELEEGLDAHLTRPYVMSDTLRELRLAAARWSRAIWAAAEGAGPIDLESSAIARGMHLARRPVFVCGIHRSGTTLMRDLLDAHPKLAVLPSEGQYLTGFERRLRRLSLQNRLRYLGEEWVLRLANPIHREPYWLLGRSSADHSPYVEFARSVQAWWPIAREHVGAFAATWPLVAVALAYARCACGLATSARLERWVEKTPTNEQFLVRLQAEFPEAKVIHLVRHPLAVFASSKQEWRNMGQAMPQPTRVLADLRTSYRLALQYSVERRANYLLVRYEDLIDAHRDTIHRVADHLGIEPLETLTHPTVAGVPVAPNSAYLSTPAPAGSICKLAEQRWTEVLSDSERERVASAVGDLARRLGYDVEAPVTWGRRVRRLFSAAS